jgi:uncharacterized protein
MCAPTTLRALFAAGLAVIVTACGSVARPGGIDGHEFARFPPVASPASTPLPPPPRTAQVERRYLLALFADAQKVWRYEFQRAHFRYDPAHVVVFSGAIRSPCGQHETGAGPFYCPGDATVYLDTSFFIRFTHGGEVDAAAQAYIVGHEVAHHVQRQAGIADRIGATTKANLREENRLTTKAELQADCLAGVWARAAYPRSALTTADLVKGLEAADVIGDDYDTRRRGEYSLDTAAWTHGSSTQRQVWLRTGFNSGRPAACNTFAYG